MPSTSACCPDKRHGPCRPPSKQASHVGETIVGVFCAVAGHCSRDRCAHEHSYRSTGTMVCNLRSDAVAFVASSTREPGAQPRPTTFPASSRDHRTGQQRHAPSVLIHCKASGIALPSRTAASLNATILISTAGRCSSLASTASATAVGASPASPLAVRIARVTQTISQPENAQNKGFCARPCQ